MNIIFMGTPDFAVPSLEILFKNKYNISAVVTAPDKRKGRGQKVSYTAVKIYSEGKIPVILQPENLSDKEFIKSVNSLNPDLIIVVAFRILPEEVFSVPKLGSFNLHASLLPEFRGAAPINHALIEGKDITGVTTFFLKKKVDTGSIILQKKIQINDDDNAGTLHDKLSIAGAECVLETVKLIESGNVQTIIQDESKATPAPKIFRENCIINWNFDSLRIHNLIRGLSPHPGAFTHLNNKVLKIFKSGLTGLISTDPPGTLVFEDKRLFVNCGDCKLEILELQSEGKNKISGRDFINFLNSVKNSEDHLYQLF